MKLKLVKIFVLAALFSACNTSVQDVDFCRVLTSPADFENRTIRTEIIAVADLHGRFAMSSQCHRTTGFAPSIGFVPASFEGSPARRSLNDEIEKAYLTRDGPLPWKAVAVRVTARVEAFEPPQPKYLLTVLDARDEKLVDVPSDVFNPPGEKGLPSRSP